MTKRIIPEEGGGLFRNFFRRHIQPYLGHVLIHLLLAHGRNVFCKVGEGTEVKPLSAYAGRKWVVEDGALPTNFGLKGGAGVSSSESRVVKSHRGSGGGRAWSMSSSVVVWGLSSVKPQGDARDDLRMRLSNWISASIWFCHF